MPGAGRICGNSSWAEATICPGMIEDDRPARCGALIEGENVLRHRVDIRLLYTKRNSFRLLIVEWNPLRFNGTCSSYPALAFPPRAVYAPSTIFPRGR